MHRSAVKPSLVISALVLLNVLAMEQSQSVYFTGTKLNNSTFRIVENDKYDEIPFIYAKVYSSAIVLIDTGCGSGDASNSLRTFLETSPIPNNENAPINHSAKPYVVISTHCHYDHIGGMTEFADSPDTTIWASAHNKCFLSPRRLPSSSLCIDVGMKTPVYTITNWADDEQRVADRNGLDLNLTIYHTPGHTPDQLAIWDSEERHLFVGDTLYEDAAIYFLNGGSLFDYSKTLTKLRTLVEGWNTEPDNNGIMRRVKIAAGHLTSGVDAAKLLAEMDGFLDQVIAGEVPARDKMDTVFGRMMRVYELQNGRLSFEGFVKTFEDFLGAVPESRLLAQQ